MRGPKFGLASPHAPRQLLAAELPGPLRPTLPAQPGGAGNGNNSNNNKNKTGHLGPGRAISQGKIHRYKTPMKPPAGAASAGSAKFGCQGEEEAPTSGQCRRPGLRAQCAPPPPLLLLLLLPPPPLLFLPPPLLCAAAAARAAGRRAAEPRVGAVSGSGCACARRRGGRAPGAEVWRHLPAERRRRGGGARLARWQRPPEVKGAAAVRAAVAASG